MLAGPIFYFCLFLFALLLAKYIQSNRSSFTAKYWAVALFIAGLLIIIFAGISMMNNTHSINKFVSENQFEPDNYANLVYLFIGAVGLSIVVTSSPLMYRQIRQRHKLKK